METDNLDVLNKLSSISKDVKDEIENFNKKVENHFEFIQEEVQIRIESLKAKLDEFGKTFGEKATEEKLKLKEHVMDSLKLTEYEIQKLENEIIKTDQNHTTTCNLFEDLNRRLASLRDYKLNIYAKNRLFQITERSIESIENLFNVTQMLHNLHYKNIDLNFLPNRVFKICDNKYILTKMDFQFSIDITDSSFEKYNKFDFSFFPLRLVTADSNFIYAIHSRRLVKFDPNLKVVLQKSLTEIGDDKTYSRLYCNNNKIYLCDNNSIDMFSSDITDMAKSYNLTCKEIYDAQMIGNVVCISCCSDEFMFRLQFYNLDEERFIIEYDLCRQAIAVYDNKIFITYDGSRLIFFDKSGIVIIQKEFNVGLPVAITSFDNNLFVSLSDQKRVVKVTMNA